MKHIHHLFDSSRCFAHLAKQIHQLINQYRCFPCCIIPASELGGIRAIISRFKDYIIRDIKDAIFLTDQYTTLSACHLSEYDDQSSTWHLIVFCHYPELPLYWTRNEGVDETVEAAET